MNPFTQLNQQLNIMIEEALSNEGGAIHINTADAEIIIQLDDNKIITVIYQRGTIERGFNKTRKYSAGFWLHSRARESGA